MLAKTENAAQADALRYIQNIALEVNHQLSRLQYLELSIAPDATVTAFEDLCRLRSSLIHLESSIREGQG